MEKIKILIVMASAHLSTYKDTRNDSGTEVRQIKEAITRSKNRDSFEIAIKSAASFEDLRQALLDDSPKILHFAGCRYHPKGLVLEDENGSAQIVSIEILSKILSLFSQQLECVILSAAYSKEQAQQIEKSIDCVVGMGNGVTHAGAVSFSAGFYDTIGAGRSYSLAFQLGCIAIKFQDDASTTTPFFIDNSVSDGNNQPKDKNNRLDDLNQSISHETLTGLSAVQAKSLQYRLVALNEDHQAISHQISYVFNEVEKTKLNRQRKKIEEEIAELETELDGLVSN